MYFVIHYVVTAGLFIVIDAIWIGLIANKFYKSQLGSLLTDKPRFIPAGIFYLLYIFAIVIFVLHPALGVHSAAYAASHGALLGLCMYATYDLTNLSTLKKWPLKLVVVDMAWGTLVTTLVAMITFIIFQ